MKLKQKCFCGAILGLLLAVGSFGSDVIAGSVVVKGTADFRTENQLALIPRPGTGDDGPPASRMS